MLNKNVQVFWERLECFKGGSNKYYAALKITSTEPNAPGSKSLLMFLSGGIGNAPTIQKIEVLPVAVAQLILDRQVKAKLKKGYAHQAPSDSFKLPAKTAFNKVWSTLCTGRLPSNSDFTRLENGIRDMFGEEDELNEWIGPPGISDTPVKLEPKQDPATVYSNWGMF